MQRKAMLRSIVIVAIIAAGLVGCEKEGPMERAGKSIDQAVDSAKEAVRPEGTLEKAGKSVDQAIDKASGGSK
ncbi:MAG: hypothetical protein JNM61_13225 [Zoogloeaceae bacterium]|nr:hypothetical protein [Zoogloeaceae bacterium]